MKNHTPTRNYLIFQLFFSNATHSGCIINMQLEAFQKAIEEGESHIIQVREHKTAKTYGCAEIIVPHEVYIYM